MNRKLFLSVFVIGVLLSFSFVALVAADPLVWSQVYGSAEYEEVSFAVVEADDGGYAIAGIKDPWGSMSYDLWLVKTDEFGNMEWNKTFGPLDSASLDYPPVKAATCSLVVTPDGGYALAGTTYVFGGDMSTFLLIKTDESGNMEWNRTYIGGCHDQTQSLIAMSDGGYAIAGQTYSSPSGYKTDCLLIRIDADGEPEWNQTYGGPESESVHSLITTSDDGYALTGTTNHNFLLIKTDASGSMEWNQTYGGDGVQVAYSVVEALDGGYAMVGGNLLVKTDEWGTMEWNKTYGGGHCRSLVATEDGGYLMAGYTEVLGAGGRDFWLVKTDSDGRIEWMRTHGGTEDDEGYWLSATSDGGYILAGSTKSFGAEEYDFWVTKLDEYGFIPEYSSPLILSLLLTVTTFIIVYKKRLFKQQT